MDIIEKIFTGHPISIVISNPRGGVEFRRINIRPVGEKYQFERLTEKQAFHTNLTESAAIESIHELLSSDFRQLDAKTEKAEFTVKISKKGKQFVSERAIEATAKETSHDRKKKYLLDTGEPVPVLRDLGVITADGKIAAPMYDKFRQINRFVELIDDAVSKDPREEFKIIDFGCGKSYLTFVLHYYLTKIAGRKVKIVGLDLKTDVVNNCEELARKYRCDGLSFECGDIGGYQPSFQPDMVISLHACDIATDLALFNAISWKSDYIFSVPCCQHEMNKTVRFDKLSALGDYGIIKERVSALATDALRGKLLEYCGYRTQLVEFIDIEHSPKNILIRAERKNISSAKRDAAMVSAKNLLSEFCGENTLYRLITNK